MQASSKSTLLTSTMTKPVSSSPADSSIISRSTSCETNGGDDFGAGNIVCHALVSCCCPTLPLVIAIVIGVDPECRMGEAKQRHTQWSDCVKAARLVERDRTNH